MPRNVPRLIFRILTGGNIQMRVVEIDVPAEYAQEFREDAWIVNLLYHRFVFLDDVGD